MAAARMDEIGLIVTGFEDGYLHVQALGGVDRRVLLGLSVRVHGREAISGVIGSRPPHVLPMSERQVILPWHELYVDTGLSPEETRALVRVGDAITIRQPTVALKNGRVAGKAMDNRASLAAVTLALEALGHRTHVWDFYAVATVQEEVGIKGAIASAYGINPDLAVALDVTFAKQHDDSDSGTFDLGKGPTVGVGPNFHPEMVKRLTRAADSEEIPYEIEPLPGSSGTDAWGIQLAREGIPSGLISIPVRYMHQPVEDRRHDRHRARGTALGPIRGRFGAWLHSPLGGRGMTTLTDRLGILSNAPGISGNESAVRRAIRPMIEQHIDAPRVDGVGNLIARKAGNGTSSLRVLITAHMDEVGLMVVGHTGDGDLRVGTVGSIAERLLPGLTVTVGEEAMPGVIGVQAIHRANKGSLDKALAWTS